MDAPSKFHVVWISLQSRIDYRGLVVHGADSYGGGKQNTENVPIFEQLLFYGNNSFRRDFFFQGRQMTGATRSCPKPVIRVRFRCTYHAVQANGGKRTSPHLRQKPGDIPFSSPGATKKKKNSFFLDDHCVGRMCAKSWVLKRFLTPDLYHS